MNLRPAALAAIAVLASIPAQADPALGLVRSRFTVIKNNTDLPIKLRVVDKFLTVGNYYVATGVSDPKPRKVVGKVKSQPADRFLAEVPAKQAIYLYFDTTALSFSSIFAIEATDDDGHAVEMDVNLSFKKFGSSFASKNVTFKDMTVDKKVNYTVNDAAFMDPGKAWLTIDSVETIDPASK